MGDEKKSSPLATLISGLSTTNPKYFEIPFVQGLVHKGRYVTHPEEPSIFTSTPNGISLYWASWLFHMLMKGNAGTDNFRERSKHELPPELRNIAFCVQRVINAELAGPPPIRLPLKPPSVWTDNGRYISQRWVLDTCRRDHMSPHEAVAVAKALVR